MGNLPRAVFGIREYNLTPIPRYRYWVVQLSNGLPSIRRFNFVKACCNELGALRGRVKDAEEFVGFKQALEKVKPLMIVRAAEEALKSEVAKPVVDEKYVVGLNSGKNVLGCYIPIIDESSTC